LARRSLHLETLTLKQQMVLPAKTLNELTKLLPDQNQLISFICTENQVLFHWQHAWFFSRVLDGVYPDTTKIIPTTFKTEMTLPTALLRDSIDRASLMSREEKSNVVQLTTLQSNLIEIASNTTEIGRVTEQLELSKFTGESLKIAFNSRFIMDVLRVIESEEVFIGFTGPMSPIILKPVDETDLIHLILPYRTTGKA
jgi:DNA polymerase III subunit beta